MARGIEKLTESKIEKAKDGDFISDGRNLYLQVRGGIKSYVFQYKDANKPVVTMGLGSIHAVTLERVRQEAAQYRIQRKQGIDPYDAREKAKQAAIDAAKLEAAKNETFRESAEIWMAKRTRWGESRRTIVASQFREYVYPKIGDLPIQRFDIRQDKTGRDLIVEIVLQQTKVKKGKNKGKLGRLWDVKFTTAKGLQENIEAVLNSAMIRGALATGPNAATYQDNLDELLPDITHEVENHPALPYKQIAEFMVKLRAHRDAGNRHKLPVTLQPNPERCAVCSSPHLNDIGAAKRAGATIGNLEKQFGIRWNTLFHHFRTHDPEAIDLNTTRREKAAWALEFMVLTAVRKSQARSPRWDEIDLEDGIWRCKKHKARKRNQGGDARRLDYVVPLSTQAVTVLETMKAYQEANGIKSDYVFPGSKGGKNPLSRTACNKFLRVSLGYPHEVATVHGFRTTFGDWADEATEFEEKDSEMALGHQIGTTVRNIYKRNSKRIEQRRVMMQAWADYCDRGAPLPSEKGKIIHAAKRFAAK